MYSLIIFDFNGTLCRSEPIIQKIVHQNFAYTTAPLALYPGVPQLLAKLQKAGILIAILSNKQIELLQSELKQTHIAQYASAVIGIQSEGLCKPNPDIYTYYIQPIFPDISPEHILMVGDTSTDLEFARAISVDACWARYGYGNFNTCEALKPRYIISEFSELNRILPI